MGVLSTTEGGLTETPTKPLNGPDTSATEPMDTAEKEKIESMTQTRFKHVETEEGHMVLTGRDGVLLRCEDEVSKPEKAEKGGKQ